MRCRAKGDSLLMHASAGCGDVPSGAPLRLRALPHSRPQRYPFLNRAQRAPERLLELFLHALAEAVGCESVSNETAVPHEAGLLDFPKRPATVRTCERRRRSVERACAQGIGAGLLGARIFGLDSSAGP